MGRGGLQRASKTEYMYSYMYAKTEYMHTYAYIHNLYKKINKTKVQ
jgi:hypothetical protein